MILSHIGHIPKIGETTTIGNFILEIVDMDGRRIDQVLVCRKTGTTTFSS
jgi:putative hemolysin